MPGGNLYMLSDYLFFVYPVLLLRLLLRPALCFLIVTLLRRLLKFPRPYDVYEYIPSVIIIREKLQLSKPAYSQRSHHCLGAFPTLE